MTTNQETEAKYHLPTTVARARLATLRLAPYTLHFEKDEQQQNSLLDTPDHLFYHRGYALRLRRTPSELLLTLKRPGQVIGSVHIREELEAPVAKEDAYTPRRWPAQIAAPALALIGDARVSPLVELHTHRETWRVERNGELVAELVMDRGTLVAGGATADIQEVEIELKGTGAPDDLAQLDQRLRKRLSLTPEPDSKFARGMALLEAHEQYHGGYVPVVAAGRDLVEQEVKKLRKHGEWLERHSRRSHMRGDPQKASNHIHKLRVMTRRLRIALDLVGAAPGVEAKALHRLDRRLQRLGRVLGALRDGEIIQQKLAERWQPNVSEGRALVASRMAAPQVRKARRIMREVTAQRQSAQAGLHAALRDGAIEALATDLERVARRLRQLERANAAGGAELQLRQVAGGMVWRQYEEVERLGALAMRANALPDERHRLRRSCKRLRYMLEALQRVAGGPIIDDTLVTAVTHAQDHLGALQDDVLMLRALHDAEMEATESGRASKTSGDAHERPHDHRNAHGRQVGAVEALADETKHDLAHGVAAFWPLWERLSGAAYRAALAKALARL